MENGKNPHRKIRGASVTPLIAQRDYREDVNSFEYVSSESKTVPDESYPIAEILRKFSSLPNLMRDAQYHDGDHDSLDVEKIQHMDLVDKSIIRDAVREDVKKFEAQYKAEKAQSDAETAERENAIKEVIADKKKKSAAGEVKADADTKPRSDEGATTAK